MFWFIAIALTIIYYIVLIKIDKKMQRAFLIEQTAMGSIEDKSSERVQPDRNTVPVVIEKVTAANTESIQPIAEIIEPTVLSQKHETEEPVLPIEETKIELEAKEEAEKSVEVKSSHYEKNNSTSTLAKSTEKEEPKLVESTPLIQKIDESKIKIIESEVTPKVKTKLTSKKRSRKSTTLTKKKQTQKEEPKPKKKDLSAAAKKSSAIISEGNNYLFQQMIISQELEAQATKTESEEINLGASTLDDLLNNEPAHHSRNVLSSISDEEE